MKKQLTGIFLVLIVAAGLFAQDLDNPISLTTRPLSPQILSELGMKQAEIQELLRYQKEYRVIAERTTLELNLIKAKLAQLLYYPDSNESEINALLEQAGELRLEREMAQVRTHLRIRELLGEDLWVKLRERERLELVLRQRNERRDSSPAANGSPGLAPGTPSGPGAGGSGGQGSSSPGR